ncbi:MAG: ribosome maturation factor RimM [Lachnospiraceae bacterium]|nr:ribosome maturation factor RimM [Lachnospiraceae bacterium]
MEDLLQVGAITSTHGVHGEVKVFPTTDDVKRFSKLKEVELETTSGTTTLHIKGVKYFKQFAILKFEEFDSLNAVETIKGKKLYVTRKNAVKLQKDEYFIADLIGMKVVDNVLQLEGTLTDVIQTGANDVYDIALSDGRQFLLPAISDCILNVDMENRLISIHVLEGLLDE